MDDGDLRSIVMRCMDVALAGALVLLALPILAAVAVLVLADDPRAGLVYRSRRAGRGGREFTVLKFRKMRREAGLPITADGDPRFTGVGRLLAATKLDELPQLLNVLRGEMSLVGPRPEDPRFVALHPEAFARILRVRPGITGPAQLAFAREAAILDPDDPVGDYMARILPAKIAIDLQYVACKSPATDLRFLAWTAIATVLRRDVAVHRDDLRCGRRRRPVAAAAVQRATGRRAAVLELPAHTIMTGAADLGPDLVHRAASAPPDPRP